MSGVNVEDSDRLFCDTSTLLSYILDQDEGEVKQLLTEVNRHIIISEKVLSELETVPDRRDQIYMDFMEVIVSDEEQIEDLSIEDREYIHPNDYSTFQTLKNEIAEENQEDRLTRLREEQKLIDRRYGQTKEIVEEVIEQNDDFGLLLSIGQVVENDDDCQVIADATRWSGNGGCGDFVTLDFDDILNNEDQINDQIREYHNESWELYTYTPSDIVDDWEYQF